MSSADAKWVVFEISGSSGDVFTIECENIDPARDNYSELQIVALDSAAAPQTSPGTLIYGK